MIPFAKCLEFSVEELAYVPPLDVRAHRPFPTIVQNREENEPAIINKWASVASRETTLSPRRVKLEEYERECAHTMEAKPDWHPIPDNTKQIEGTQTDLKWSDGRRWSEMVRR